MIGERTESNNKKAKLFQIGSYVRDVLPPQPTRRYVRAFTRYENEMRAWVDRSGPYNSTVFNIHEGPEHCRSTITAYVTMSNDELGLNTFAERAYQRAIVCRDMACFCAKISSTEDLYYSATFFWVSDKRQQEANPHKLIHKEK